LSLRGIRRPIVRQRAACARPPAGGIGCGSRSGREVCPLGVGIEAMRRWEAIVHALGMTVAPIRVLIAADPFGGRRGIGALLASVGAIEVVAEATTGVEAVREAQLTRPDVIIMDIQMPVMDGIEATLRLSVLVPDAAVLVLTMFEDDASVLSAM